MVSIEIRDDFFSVFIHMDRQKYGKFFFKNIFRSTCMPNEYDSEIRAPTKISA